jgi:MFS family permease
VPGRLVPALIADRYLGPLQTLIPTVFVAGILVYSWSAIKSLNGYYAFVIVFGYFGAGVQSLNPAALSALTTDLQKVGVRVGMVFTIVSFAVLSGEPIAGRLIQDRHGDYLAAQIFGGTVMLCGSFLLVASRIAETGLHLRKKM